MYTSTAVLGKCVSETITSAATLAKATPSRSSCAPRSIAKTEHQNAKHGLPFDVWCIGRAFVLWCLALHCVGRILQGLHGAPESAGRRPARGCGSGRAEINWRFIMLRALFKAGMHRLCAFTVSFLSGGVTSRRRVRGLVGSEGGGAAIRSMKDVRRCSKSCGRLSTSWGHQRSELVSAHLRHLARRSCWAFSREGWRPADLGSLAACRQTDSGRALATSPGPLWLYVVLGKETEFQKAEPT